MRRTSVKPKSLRKELNAVLRENDNCKLMLRAVVDKAIGGDMKAFDAIRDILSEGQKEDTRAEVTINLGKGVEELAK